jgi:hypothetical protein
MSAEQIIKEVQENISEWLEMSECPEVALLWAVAHRASLYKAHLECLKKRTDYYESKFNSNA